MYHDASLTRRDRGILWAKLKTGGKGHCIKKKVLLLKLQRLPKLSKKLCKSVGGTNIVAELGADVEADPEALMSISDFIKWLDPREDQDAVDDSDEKLISDDDRQSAGVGVIVQVAATGVTRVADTVSATACCESNSSHAALCPISKNRRYLRDGDAVSSAPSVPEIIAKSTKVLAEVSACRISQTQECPSPEDDGQDNARISAETAQTDKHLDRNNVICTHTSSTHPETAPQEGTASSSNSTAAPHEDIVESQEVVKVQPPPPPFDTTAISKTPEIPAKTTYVIFTCRRCRFLLFTESDLESHQVGKHVFQSKRIQKPHRKQCQSIFVKGPCAWMEPLAGSAQKIQCPKCRGKLGHASWIGSQCSCGTWITPAFQFSKGKIDAKVRRIARPV